MYIWFFTCQWLLARNCYKMSLKRYRKWLAQQVEKWQRVNYSNLTIQSAGPSRYYLTSVTQNPHQVTSWLTPPQSLHVISCKWLNQSNIDLDRCTRMMPMHQIVSLHILLSPSLSKGECFRHYKSLHYSLRNRWEFCLFFIRYVSKCLQAQIGLTRETLYRSIALSQVETLSITPRNLVTILRRTN